MTATKSRKGIGRPSRVGPDGWRDVMVRLPVEAWEVLAERAVGSRAGVAGVVRAIVLQRLEADGD